METNQAKEDAQPVNFRRHFVSMGTVKARVYYSLDNRVDNRRCVTMYAKGYEDGGRLREIFADQYKNDSDLHTDYFEKGKAVLFADHPLYATARAHVEALEAAKA
jgi:hypothetical protein